MIKKLIFVLLLIPALGFAQQNFSDESLFAAADTIGSITIPDSVEMQFYNGPWKLLTECVNDTSYVTADDKTGEVLKIFNLASETWWTYSKSLRFRVYATGTDTITSSRVYPPAGLGGAYTLYLQPDTSGTNTYYDGSWIEGN